MPKRSTAGERAEKRGGQPRPGRPGADRNKKPRESKAAAARRKESDRKQADRERQQQEEENREFDRSFKETPFERLVGTLPIREPPLYVEQYITEEDTHKVFTAVGEKRFFCKMTPRQREKAVTDFYRAADKILRGGKIQDFEQVVTPLAETLEKLPALAIARDGSVSLTRLGRGRGPC